MKQAFCLCKPRSNAYLDSETFFKYVPAVLFWLTSMTHLTALLRHKTTDSQRIRTAVTVSYVITWLSLCVFICLIVTTSSTIDSYIMVWHSVTFPNISFQTGIHWNHHRSYWKDEEKKSNYKTWPTCFIMSG